MSKKHISITIILIVLMIVLSEINNSRTKQQLENIRYEAEERLKNSEEKLLKDHFSDDPTTDPKKDSTIHYMSCFLKQHKNHGDLASTNDLASTTKVTIDEGRKHISVDYLTEGNYTEKDNIIFAEHSHEGDPFLANRGKAHVVVLRLDKISNSLSVGKYDQSEEDEVRPPSYERIYQCE